MLIGQMTQLQKISERIKEGLSQDIDSKELKKILADEQVRLIAVQYCEALDNKDLKEAAKWGEKIEEYCIGKPKDAGPLEDGMGKLMEAIAAFMRDNPNNQKQIEENASESSSGGD
jgi:hypothetical protein